MTETIKHSLEVPRPYIQVQNNRQVSIITSTLTVHLISSYPDEDIQFLSRKALGLLRRMKE